MGGGFDAHDAVAAVRAALVRDADLAEEHVVVTWQTLDAASGESRSVVDVFAPDFHPADRVESMLRSVAASVAHAAGLRSADVFVNYRAARSDEVFDGGDIVRW